MTTAPAPFPSVLRCSGRDLVDSNGSIMPVMKGFCAQIVPWSAQDFADMYNIGARMVRLIVFWDRLEPAPGSIDSAFVAKLDLSIQRCAAAGLYCWIGFYFGPNGGHMPSWAQTTAGPASRMGNYIANGRYATQYLAMRYGDRSDPLGAGQYTPALTGFGINEPTPDQRDTPNWITGILAQQAQMAAWFRAYAPDWIASVSPPWGNTAPIPNAAGSGQGRQNFTGISANPSGLTNFWIDYHDYFWATTNYANPRFDGRNAWGRPRTVVQGGTAIVARSGFNYPPVVNGHTLTPSEIAQMNAAWHAPQVEYCKAANVPLLLGEVGWPPPIATGWAAHIADKTAQWADMHPVGVLEWDYSVNQAKSPWAARPGVGAPGADPDGWQAWTNTLMATDISPAPGRYPA